MLLKIKIISVKHSYVYFVHKVHAFHFCFQIQVIHFLNVRELSISSIIVKIDISKLVRYLQKFQL